MEERRLQDVVRHWAEGEKREREFGMTMNLKMRGRFALGMVLVCLLGTGSAHAQASFESKHDSVVYLFPEQVSVPVGKPSAVALHFQIERGLHINSHTPKGDFLVPTVLAIPEDSGVKLAQATYPPGEDFTLPIDHKTRLSVYTGEFVIQARIVAERGNHMVEAKLHYQACDLNSCMPPRTITVPIDVIGK